MSKDINTQLGTLQRSSYDPWIETVVFQKVHPSPRAVYALKLADHLGVVAATDDGEDSSGRAKLRLMKPAEVARRAWEISDELFNILEAEGQMLGLPDPYVKDREKKPEPVAT